MAVFMHGTVYYSKLVPAALSSGIALTAQVSVGLSIIVYAKVWSCAELPREMEGTASSLHRHVLFSKSIVLLRFEVSK